MARLATLRATALTATPFLKEWNGPTQRWMVVRRICSILLGTAEPT
jgi:hypothetical protein